MEIRELKRDIEEARITVEFEERGKKGVFRYNLVGENKGIEYCENYEEDSDEDIYAKIHDWVDRNVEVKIDITVKDLK